MPRAREYTRCRCLLTSVSNACRSPFAVRAIRSSSVTAFISIGRAPALFVERQRSAVFLAAGRRIAVLQRAGILVIGRLPALRIAVLAGDRGARRRYAAAAGGRFLGRPSGRL